MMASHKGAGQRPAEELDALLHLGHSLASQQDLNDVIFQIILRLRHVVDADAVSIILPDEEKREFSFCWASNGDPSHSMKLKEMTFSCEMGIAGNVYFHGNPELIQDAQLDPRHYKAIDRILGFTTRSMIAVPLHGKTGPIGVLEILNKKRGAFDDRDFKLVVASAGMIGIALENAMIYEELKMSNARLQLSEKELKRHRSQLEKIVEERTSALMRANERLRREISERKQAETEKESLQAHLMETQKMEAIATLAGGVAHEFNNALMSIMGNIDLLKIHFSANGEMQRYIHPMKKESARMADLTRQLLAYAREGKYQSMELSLRRFMKDTSPFIKYMVEPHVRVGVDISDHVPLVHADPTQLQMVISSVLKNASEAVSGEGSITLSIHGVQVQTSSDNHRRGLKPGQYACIEVKDEGRGMDETTLAKIFEPFFTTKFQGRGLGMAAAYGIIKNHHGEIHVDSYPGKGTVVRIYLPAA
jgi:C4-dicarboxylate-specific signal transduction histidine kinase